MEMILINDNESKTVLYLSNKSFYGYKFYNDNKIEKVDKSIFKYFDFLFPSNNYTKLGVEDGYHVILDNETNFKHYIKNGSFDYQKFLENNGENIILFDKENDKYINDYKLFKYYERLLKKTVTIGICLSSTVLLIAAYKYYDFVNQLNSKINNKDTMLQVIEFEELSKDDLSNMIFSSKNISEENKNYLNNTELFEDILPYINESNYMKYMYNQKFNQIDLDIYKGNNQYGTGYQGGYYNPLEPNIIHMHEVCTNNDYRSCDVISHEFIHLCQNDNQYENVIIEATAEIYSYEYFKNIANDSYKEQVKAIKKLMEIIGTEPIKRFIFTGDFSMIEQAVKPYLNDDEYELFLESLHFDQKYDDTCDELHNIIATLYERKYNDNISNNIIFNLIDKNDDSLVRYYFNPRLINQENSYYYTDVIEQIKYTYEEAYNKGLIEILPAEKKDNTEAYNFSKSISYDEFIKGNYNSYKINLLTIGYVDYINQKVIINNRTKIYINPIDNLNNSLKK